MELEGTQIVTLVVLGVSVLLFFVLVFTYMNFKSKQKQLMESVYSKEVVGVQIEIREETLKNISWELQDNIGQLMTLAKIQVQNAKNCPNKIAQVAETIEYGLKELRMLSKIINPDVIKNLNLEEAILLELERFNRLNYIESKYKSTGVKQHIKPEEGIILFRIIQEFFTNTIRHSQATVLGVHLNYNKEQLRIMVKDNGIGFDKSLSKGEGFGIERMKSRIELIGATLNLKSVVGKGTHLNIIHNLNKK